MLRTLSLGGLDFVVSDEVLTSQYVTVRTGPGDDDFANVLLGDFRTFMTRVVNDRIDNIDVGTGGSGPSIWPVQRTITLAGLLTGSVALDGSSDVTLNAEMADNALPIVKVNGLASALDGKLGSTATAVAAEKLATARTVALTGRVTGSATFDGSDNISIVTSIANNALSVAMVNGLATQLAGKASLEGGNTFNGNQTVRGTQFVRGAGGVGNAVVALGNGVENPGGAGGELFWSQADGFFGLRKYNAAGTGFSTRIELLEAGVEINGNTVWHAGNLSPTSFQYLSQDVVAYGAGSTGFNNLPIGSKALISSSNTNAPSHANVSTWYVETLRIGTGSDASATLLQRAWSTTSAVAVTRRRESGTWSAWRETWNSESFQPSSKLGSNDTAASAYKWLQARTLSLTGPVTGQVSFDGSGDVVLNTSLGSVLAGNGLTGGGALTADRTITLGTPGSLGGTTTNAVQASSHTHRLLNITDSALATVFHGDAGSAGTNVPSLYLYKAGGFCFATNNDVAARWDASGTQTAGTVPWARLTGHPSVVAGNGLAGGGTLADNRTLTLGTPGTITGGTTNNVTAASHTHALGTNLSAWDGVHPNMYVRNNAVNAPDATQRLDAGFYQASNPTAGYPQNGAGSGWWHLLSSTHNNTSNYYAMQFAAQFDNPTELWYRNTGAVGTRAWHKIWNSGNVTPLDVISGGNVWSTLNVYAGGFASQTRLMNFGYNNGTPRWAKVIEADASLAFYGYDGNGAAPRRILHIAATHAGNEDQVTVAGRVRSQTGHFAATGANAVLSATSAVYLRPNGEDSASGQAVLNNAGHLTVAGGVFGSGDFSTSGAVRAHTNGTGGLAVMIGNDAGLYDVNVANTFGVCGAQDGNIGGILFGTNGTHVTGSSSGLTVNRSVTATDFIISSDRSLKRDIVDLAVAKEGWLQPRTYFHIETGEIENGFVAQDVKKLYPRMVTRREDGKLAVRYPRLTAALAHQDLVLRDELRAQNKRIKQLEKLVKKLLGK